MTTRREAVTALAATTAIGLRALPFTLHPHTSSIPAVGLQLYTVRAEMENSVAGTLERIAEIGYKEVEFWQYYDRSASEIRTLLDDLGMTAPAVHVGLEQLETEWEAIVDYAATVGHRYLVVAHIDPQDLGDLDKYRRIVDRFNQVSERARAAGMVFGYHNHDFEFDAVDGQIPFDVMLAHADPGIQFEMDLFWIIQGGGDPVDYFRRYPGRFPMVHVKDMASDGSMVDVGAGEIDFLRIFAQSDRAGIQHYFVEHDNPSSPFGSIRASYDYLRRLEF